MQLQRIAGVSGPLTSKNHWFPIATNIGKSGGRVVSEAQERVGSLDVALSHAARLLNSRPTIAVEQTDEILKICPGHPAATLLKASALRLSGDPTAAIMLLLSLNQTNPPWPGLHHELGLSFGAAGQSDQAIAALRRALQLRPNLADAWRALADQLDAIGDAVGADEARARFIKAATTDPRLIAAASALVENHLPEAEALLRAHLKLHETDIAALRMLAEVAARLRRYADAEILLAHCLQLAPGFNPARQNYAMVLLRQAKAAQALPHAEQLLSQEPNHPGYRNLKAAILANLGEYAGAIEVYEAVLKDFPRQSKVWMSYGHSLKTAGRVNDSIAAYRRAIAIEPNLSEAYWSLANLKTFAFAAEDISAIRAALACGRLTPDERLHFEFSLGKGLEDAAEYDESFAHYSEGCSIRRALIAYNPDENSGQIRRAKELYTAGFFAERAGAGAGATDPIFVVGLPRSGSTLIEQILASHPLVEGTMELPDIQNIVRDLIGRKRRNDAPRYPGVVQPMTTDQLRALGERYLRDTRVQRKTTVPHFIDKMPNNFLHVGFIHLLLPNAKIIDARRHPLGCCFSNFKQQFARGQDFSYSLTDVGRYYRDYVELMAHFDEVLPGRVHRIHYEQMIDDTEAEIRRLLDYCGLPFDEQCLRFYQNERAVRTASSEQVRRPIYRQGVDHWRHYEPWLGPLKEALGSVLEAYPLVPNNTN